MSIPYANTPASLDKKGYQGSDFYWEFTVWSNSEPVDLENVLIKMTVKKQRGKDVPILWSGNTEDGEIVVSNTNKVAISISKPDMGALPAGSLVYEVDLTVSGKTYTYLTGQFFVSMEVED
jgi:hypothetical protein